MISTIGRTITLNDHLPPSSPWITPQDVSQHWAKLAPSLEAMATDHANEEMTLSLIVGNGLVADILEAGYCRYEPRSNGGRGVYEPQPWWSLIRRLIRTTAELNGTRAVITTRIMLNAAGQPIRWTVPEYRRLEPRRV